MNDTTRLKRLHLVFDGKTPVSSTDRIWAMNLSGYTHADLARKCDVVNSVVSDTLRDVQTSHNVATALAEVTGLTLNRLWPCGKYSLSPAERGKATRRVARPGAANQSKAASQQKRAAMKKAA